MTIIGNKVRNLRYGLNQVVKRFPETSTESVDILEKLIEYKGLDLSAMRLDIPETEIALLGISDEKKKAIISLLRAYELWTQRWSSATYFDEQKNILYLLIGSGSQLIKKIELLEGESETRVREIDNSLDSLEEFSTFFFERLNSDKVRLKVTYWKDPKPVQVDFSVGPK